MPGPHQYAPQLLVYPEEHLELVAVLGHLELVDEPQGMPDQVLVVRRYADVYAALQELVEQEDVVLADGIEVLVGYVARLVVYALAQTHGETRVDYALHVLDAAAHVGLQDGARILMAPIGVVNNLQRRPRVRRVLHVDPHEAAPFGGVLDDLLQVRPAELFVQGQPEPGELDGDAALEAVFVERVYDLLVVLQLRRRVGLALGALAEEVDGGDAALLVEDPDGGERLIQRIAGYVAAGDPLHDGPRDEGHRVRYGLVHYSHG